MLPFRRAILVGARVDHMPIDVVPGVADEVTRGPDRVCRGYRAPFWPHFSVDWLSQCGAMGFA